MTVKQYPESAQTLLVDQYLTTTEAASPRVFWVDKGTPPHYHVGCGEYLFGNGSFELCDGPRMYDLVLGS